MCIFFFTPCSSIAETEHCFNVAEFLKRLKNFRDKCALQQVLGKCSTINNRLPAFHLQEEGSRAYTTVMSY